MDPEFLSIHQSALDDVTAFLGSSFVYGGVTYTGIINDLELSTENIDGGLLATIGTVIVVPISTLAVEPKAGELIYIGSRKLRIEKVKVDELAYEITCATGAK